MTLKLKKFRMFLSKLQKVTSNTNCFKYKEISYKFER